MMHSCPFFFNLPSAARASFRPALRLCVSGIYRLLFASPVLSPREISSALHDDFVLYTKYASAAYSSFAQAPLAARSFALFHLETPKGSSRFARASNHEEIVVFRGTFSLKDAVFDALVLLTPFVSPLYRQGGAHQLPDVPYCFYRWRHRVPCRALAQNRTPRGDDQALHIRYRSVHALSLSHGMLSSPHRQVRVSDAKFARFVEDAIGIENILRTVHTFDGVPTMVPRIWKYEHFATEY
ncbi:hypothetical protein B0H11DRAFT_667181 [Mycena galericulata]|nr:hypothetical protein B0H11DRAFT_667181 [Mycena galericulata]